MFSYSFDKGWQETDFTFDYDSFDDCQNAYRAAGYQEAYFLPEQVQGSFFSAEVYVFEGLDGMNSEFKYMVVLDVGDIQNIMVRDLPSLIELMSKIATVNTSTLYSESEAEKVQEFSKENAKPRAW